MTTFADRADLDLDLDLRQSSRPRLRTIEVVRSSGTGPTELAAFDAALIDAGIANFNLIRLSSVIPPDTEVVATNGRSTRATGEWGDRLYVVMAEICADRVGREAWAGIGWVQDDETGKGLFVEHEGHAEHEVREDIEQSLATLVSGRPGHSFGPVRSVVHGVRCEDRPACAMVTAVYESESWSVDLRGGP
jgi:arginine decarboxylase